ncbi:T9SS type A sorting domain-containing protein [Saccharicrinis sp. 156]|uniref:T9SS type A sorting domain-containing protein n=1 Tax=Saccharicrinis sp. 156 TaxID=3417574 RepID=UPI003D3334E5
MKRFLHIFLAIMPIMAFAQSTFKVTYDFSSNMGASVTGADVVTPELSVMGGNKLTSIGTVNDGGTSAYQSHIVNNNATNYTNTFARFDIKPKSGYTIKVSKITVTQRSSIAGVTGLSQTYLFRIGCTLNGSTPVTSNSDQSTGNIVFYDTYHSDTFLPGGSVNSAGGDNYVSAWIAARGKSNSNDEFDWYIDKVEIEGNYVAILQLPEFKVSYDFENSSLGSVISGETQLSASDISVNANSSGVTSGGRIWLKTNSNTNSIGYKAMGLYCDITPNSGYEIVLKQYRYTHAGSGVAGESRVSRVGIYRDISRSKDGVLVKKDDFTSYAGREIFGDDVNGGDLKVSEISDDFTFDTQHFFTFSVNRWGDPAQSEYWTVDDLSMDGYVIPAGRSALLIALVEGQERLSQAVVGTGSGEYAENVFDTYQATLVAAADIMKNPDASQATIDATTSEIQDANGQFVLDANKQVATLTVDDAKGHDIVEGLSGYNSRLADSGWSFKNPEWRQAMQDVGGGWLRYMSGTRNNAFNMNIGLYEVEDLDQLIEDGETASGNVTCHKRVEAKGPQTVYDLYQGLGEINSRLVVTWSGFIGEPWEAALFAKFCKDNHIEVDMWQFVNEPYFHLPNRGSYFWNDGTDFARKMHPIADSIKAYLPDAVMAPNASWDDPGNDFSRGIADYSPRFFNAFSKHSYAAYNTNTSIPMDEAVKELVGGMYYGGTESYQSILDNYGNDIPVYITEYQTWNTVSSKIMMTGIYMAEYILRMTEFSNTKLLGKHSNVSTANPYNYYSSELEAAYNNGTTLTGVDELVCGYYLSVEGKAHRIINHGINKSDYRYQSTITGDVMVEADNKHTAVTQVPALSAGVFKGTNGKRYIIITNKSGVPHKLDVQGITLPSEVEVTYIASDKATTENSDISEKAETQESDNIIIRPYSVNRIEWFQGDIAPSPSRIYDVKINSGQVSLKWWTKENADSYIIYYGSDKENLSQSLEISGGKTNSGTVTGLTDGATYYFAVAGKNSVAEGVKSNVVDAKMAFPDAPVLVSANGRTNTRLDGIITLLWRSVPDAHGYKIKYGTSSGAYTNTIDAGNVSGFRMSNLPVGQTYYINIVAYNGYGESAESNELEATTTEMRPVSPHQVRLSENTVNGELTIQWENSLDYAYGATYNIYRSDKAYSDYELVKKGVTGTSHTFNPKEKPGLWFYTVKAENINDESFYSSNKYTITTTVDTWEEENSVHDLSYFDHPVSIYPVPADDMLHIEVGQYPGNIHYKLINISGTVLKTGQVIEHEEIQVSELSTGIYILLFITEEGMFQRKIQVR